jgi:hypothetical protein
MPKTVIGQARFVQAFVWLLWVVSFLVLSLGNQIVREVEGLDFTPFEIGGLPFFVVVLPVSILLVVFGYWHEAMILLPVHASALAALIWKFLGWRAAGVALAAYFVGSVVRLSSHV